MDVEQGFEIRDLAASLRRRRAVMAVVAGCTFLLSVVIAAVLPNYYEASTLLLVEPQTISKNLVEAGLEESDLNNRLHLMTSEILSRGRLSRIIDDLKLYADESDELTREEIIELMREDIRVEPVFPELTSQLDRRQVQFDINTFLIHYRNRDARRAAAVANRLANDFIDEHIEGRVRVSGDTTEFIETELERLTARLRQVENRIAVVKAENPGILPEDLPSNQRVLERALQNLRSLQRELAIVESDEAFYRQQAIESAGGDQPVSPARQLQLLELRLAEHRSRGFTDKHPDIIATLGEIESLKTRIRDGTADDDLFSLAQSNAMAEARRAGQRAAAARQDIERVQAQIDTYEKRLAATPRVAEQLIALEREFDHLLASYQDYSRRRLEATVAADMERRQKGEQFRILESAFPPPEPTSPNRWLITLLGLFLGLALGAGTAVLLEAADSSFHEPRKLQDQLRIPVLASIPGILLEPDLVARRRRHWRNAVAATAVVAVVLLGALLGNWAVNGVPGVVKQMVGRGAVGAVVDGQG